MQSETILNNHKQTCVYFWPNFVMLIPKTKIKNKEKITLLFVGAWQFITELPRTICASTQPTQPLLAYNREWGSQSLFYANVVFCWSLVLWMRQPLPNKPRAFLASPFSVIC